MARPRIFISSTFYDFKQIRTDIERAVRELGYEAIRHETGAIPYSADARLESGAYREVETSDVIVFIMGGRYGQESKENPGYSITQTELKTALEKGIQVFIFVETSVFNEYETYKLNKDESDFKYSSVDNIAVFQFMDELYTLRQNNPITKFETTSDITSFLRDQFAGLFQRFLQDQKRNKEIDVLSEMKSIAATLKELVGFLTAQRENNDEAIRNILLNNHPIFHRLRSLTKTPYRVFFTSRTEMESWLKARNWDQIPDSNLDRDSVEEWSRDFNYLKFTNDFFDESGRLIPLTQFEWDDDWIQLQPYGPTEDDLPF